jgi:capsular exopolysaccharide synthesis family protein
MSWSPQPRPSSPSLTREIGIRKWSVAAIAAIATASGIYYSSQLPPTYAAESRVLVNSIEPAGEGSLPPSPNMATEQEIARSPEVTRVVRERLGLEVPTSELADDLSIENPADTEVLILTFVASDPTVAKEGAQAFAEEYVKLRRRGAVQAQLESAQETRDRITALAAELNRLGQRIRSESDDTVLTSLISRADTLTGLLVQERQQLGSLETTPDVGELFQPAVAFGRVGPSYSRNAVLALLLGLALGVAQAGLRGRLEDRLYSVEEAEAYLRSRALALIPSLPGIHQRQPTSGFSSGIPASVSDSFVPLRVSFLAAAPSREATVILVTSASPREGKSTITANLAVSLALAGRRVTVICADPTRHRLEQFFGASADVGLTQVLAGSAPLGLALLPNVVRNLSLLPCGRPTGSETELSQSGAMRAVFDSIRERSDFVLVDSPPLGDADAISLMPVVDSVLFVVDCRSMHARRLSIARRQLDRVNADVLGVVFNRATASVTRPEPRFLATAASSAQ